MIFFLPLSKLRWVRRRSLLCAAAVGQVVAAAPLAATDDVVNLLLVDGTTVSGRLSRATSDTLHLQIGETSKPISLSDLMLVDFPVRNSANAGPPEDRRAIFPAAGGFIYGWISGSHPDGIQASGPAIGERQTFPYESLAGLRVARRLHSAAEEVFTRRLEARSPGHDTVILLRGGQVSTFRGSIESLGPEGGRFQVDGQDVALRFDTLYAVVFASELVRSGRQPHRIDLVSGERVLGHLVRGDAERMTVDYLDASRLTLPWSQVQRITIHSDRVAFLSDLEPSRFEHTPFLNVAWPLRRDRSASNRPLRLGGTTYVKGIGVHSASRVDYELGGKYQQFAAVIGVDDAVRPRGSVVFTVQADGKEIFRSSPHTGRDDPEPVLLDIAGADRLTLIVDFGADGDLGDQADWANARVIK